MKEFYDNLPNCSLIIYVFKSNFPCLLGLLADFNGSIQTSISYSRQLNSATNTKSPPIGRLSPRALSLVETFSLFAFSPSLRNGVVAVASTKTNQGESDVSQY